MNSMYGDKKGIFLNWDTPGSFDTIKPASMTKDVIQNNPWPVSLKAYTKRPSSSQCKLQDSFLCKVALHTKVREEITQ